MRTHVCSLSAPYSVLYLRSLFSTSLFFFYSSRHPRDLHSFPTRRSSDLVRQGQSRQDQLCVGRRRHAAARRRRAVQDDDRQDRKSTRLNSSHVRISYAVFCLKKKKKKERENIKIQQFCNRLIS